MTAGGSYKVLTQWLAKLESTMPMRDGVLFQIGQIQEVSDVLLVILLDTEPLVQPIFALTPQELSRTVA